MKVFILFILLSFLSHLPNLNLYEFRNEESLRTIVAYEMYHTGKYGEPTVLGEPYFNKPTLFNWLIVLYSYFIPWSEMTARAVSLTFLVLTALLLLWSSHHITKDKHVSLLATLIFLTFGNVLFFYGYLAEIDITFSFFLFSVFVLLWLWFEKGEAHYLIFSGLLSGMAFLLKGFPSYVFYVITLLTLSMLGRRFKEIFSRKAFLSYALALFIPTLWLFTTANPHRYLTTLFLESFSRVSNEEAFYLRPIKLILLTLKDTLPTSLFLLTSLLIAFKNKSMKMPKSLSVVTVVLLANFTPYFLSNSAGRYVLPLYPFLALVSAHFINSYEKVKKSFLIILLITILLRIAFGLLFFPYYTERETSRKRIAMDIIKTVDLSKPIACNCFSELSICLYLGLAKGEPLRKLDLIPKAEYVIECSPNRLEGFIKRYSLNKDYEVYLLKIR